MSETKELLRRGAEGFAPREDVVDSLIRRRARKERNRRIAAVALAIGLTLATFAGLIRTFGNVERPADEPQDIFARVHGWIVYGMVDGLSALNPNNGQRVGLGPPRQEPLEWSADGSTLLIGEGRHFRVLSADGTETRLGRLDERRVPVIDWEPPLSAHAWPQPDVSLSPDGSQIVYSTGSRIYVIDVDGGASWLLRRASEGSVYSPAFSPDGTQIAYFDGGLDHGHSLRIMNADGTNVRVLFGHNQPQVNQIANHASGLVWSPDGSLLAFALDHAHTKGIWVISSDGSGLRQIIPGEWAAPSWSPDSSRIAYVRARSSELDMPGTLYVADRDGTHASSTLVLTTGFVAWNPLPLSPGEVESVPSVGVSDGRSVAAERESAATNGGSVAPLLVFAIAALGVVGVFVLAWRARRRTAAS